MVPLLDLPKDNRRRSMQPVTAKERCIEAALLTFGIIYCLGFWILIGLYLWRFVSARPH